jgi:hypothetical protein
MAIVFVLLFRLWLTKTLMAAASISPDISAVSCSAPPSNGTRLNLTPATFSRSSIPGQLLT